MTYRGNRINRKISSRNAVTVREQDLDATRLLLCPSAALPKGNYPLVSRSTDV